MSRPLLLDLFCGAGGAAMGYHRAGFDVIGIDIEPQANYPFEFIHTDALSHLIRNFMESASLFRYAAVHASPPCQAHLKGLRGVNAKLGRKDAHRDLIGETRELLVASGLPYVIENVTGARSALISPVQVCGSAFGLPIRRHRLFESNISLIGKSCEHHREGEKKYWTSFRKGDNARRSAVVQVYGQGAETHEWGPALGIDWMTPRELTQAIPPAYTEYIGLQLIRHTQERAA